MRSRSRRISEEINPLEGAINIVDAMLVFACGLILALVIHWNVDLDYAKERVNLNRGQEVAQDKDIQNSLNKTKLYEEMGTVYKDPATGQLFMLLKQ
ncbi:MAG: DUF2149 domain-containing protein [Eubacteriales bacterium]